MKKSDPSLRIRQMHVLWRDTFIVDRPQDGHRPTWNFNEASRERLIKLPCYVADRFSERGKQTELLRVVERASRNVARIGYDSLCRFQFQPFRVANLNPTLARMHCPPDALTPSEVETAAQEAEETGAWIEITPMLVLHRAGVGIMEYMAKWDKQGDGYTPEEAIELVRLGIAPLLLCLPDGWHSILPPNHKEWSFYCVTRTEPGRHLGVGGLRDLSQLIVAYITPPVKKKRRGAKDDPQLVKPTRPTGSSSVILEEVSPLPVTDFAPYVGKYAGPLRGVGAMDTYYRERAKWIVERELADNLSTDSEAAVFLLGNSELILFNDHLPEVLEITRKRLGVPGNDLGVIYLYMHYHVLLEWTYLQDAILRAYIQRLDGLVASTSPKRSIMISTLQGALSDMVQYQENITPYANRIEFLERAGAYHKLDELAERFERKQEMLLNYASEYHDYREARATEFLNWLAGILTGAALADLIITLAGITPDQQGLYLAITFGSILLVLAILAAVQRFL